MASRSYAANFTTYAGGDGLWGEDMDPAALTGHPYFELPAAAVLYNPVGSGKRVSVNCVNVQDVYRSSNNRNVSLTRITPPASWSGYYYEDFPVMCLTDSAATFPGTVRAADYWVAQTPIYQNVAYGRAQLADYVAGFTHLAKCQRFLIPKHGDSTAQGFVLQAGQAAYICRACQSGVNPTRLEIYIQVGGNTFLATRALTPSEALENTGNDSIFVINPSGSGVTMTIAAVYDIQEGMSPGAAYASTISIEKITAWEAIPAVSFDVPALAMDSDSAANAAVVKRNVLAWRYGSQAGAIIAKPTYQRVRQSVGYHGPGVTWAGVSGATARACRNCSDVVRNASDSCIKLTEGEGISVSFRKPGYLIGGHFTLAWEEEDVGAGGSAAYRVIGSPIVRRISL